MPKRQKVPVQISEVAMKEHLVIHNFGPIREAEMDVRDLTIFVGPQAVGKSLAAQVLYFLRGIEDLLLPEPKKPLEAALSALAWWLGNEPSVYTGPGTRFLLTTHSPYILYAINNFLMAHKVLDADRALPAGVPPETALRPEQVAAYCFSADGTVHDIMDTKVGLIDEDELDRVADELGATFTRLQERLEGVE